MTTTGKRATTGVLTGSREPLAVEFANTLYAVRGRQRDGIATPDQLAAWLSEHAAALGAGEDEPLTVAQPTTAEVADFVALRDAVRGLIRAAAGEDEVREADVTGVNAAAAIAPVWPVLRHGEDGFSSVEATDHPRLPAALAALARSAVGLLTGPTRTDLRACHGPGCVLFFVKDHPRREWCGAPCGNRARAARHYQRHREG
ncbi:CGNR zinc finger domain-containing protein [Streptacidiphilus jiangxiensis]|uniref:Conserved protein containing a Zn-ribbon-like motif, possibly RNA-binding n=1 Tax=Streptacidiphilus jiangxiensis TaxID=235985 RepID=A0A1H7RWW6_STRJI|nr:ABATE domain-containing protein [Streptacidiphilus jiangxiensis]SEL64712.1 Conserved protein containing a Zn-ribbon-like motif, possibly RNA-binding [Streptacidiphilus jiangxiensis]